MSPTNSADHEWLSTVRRYRYLFWASLVIGVLGFLVGSSLGYPIVGVGVYWAGVLGMIVIWKGTSIQVFDEREQALDRRASHITLTIVGLALIIGGPGGVIVTELGHEIPPVLDGALWGYTAQFVLFGIVYLWIRYRP